MWNTGSVNAMVESATSQCVRVPDMTLVIHTVWETMEITIYTI